MRLRVGSAIAMAALVLVLAAPAGAQQAPTLGAPPTPSVTAQTAQSSSTSTGNGGLKTWQEALIFAAGIILIGGIALAILADSRDRAAKLGGPVTEPEQAPHRHKQRSKQQARAKGKAAKSARRRNR